MLHIRSSKLFHFISKMFDQHLPIYLTPQPLETTILLFVSMSLAFLDFTCK